jgi:hypothetical protein
MTLGGLLDLGWRVLGIPIIIGFMNGLAITRVMRINYEYFRPSPRSKCVGDMSVRDGKCLATASFYVLVIILV